MTLILTAAGAALAGGLVGGLLAGRMVVMAMAREFSRPPSDREYEYE